MRVPFEEVPLDTSSCGPCRCGACRRPALTDQAQESRAAVRGGHTGYRPDLADIAYWEIEIAGLRTALPGLKVKRVAPSKVLSWLRPAATTYPCRTSASTSLPQPPARPARHYRPRRQDRLALLRGGRRPRQPGRPHRHDAAQAHRVAGRVAEAAACWFLPPPSAPVPTTGRTATRPNPSAPGPPEARNPSSSRSGAPGTS